MHSDDLLITSNTTLFINLSRCCEPWSIY